MFCGSETCVTQMWRRQVPNDRGAAGTAVTCSPKYLQRSVAAGWNWFTRGRDEDSWEGRNLQLSEGVGGGGGVMSQNSWFLT